MGRIKFYCAGTTEAARIAARCMEKSGISFGRDPCGDITDLILDVPSFDSHSNLKSGEDPNTLFPRLSPGTRIWGGKLRPMEGLIPIDLLQDCTYLAENAAITADCALKLAAPMLKTTWKASTVLIIGWGRIGKHLSKMLKPYGTAVTVCARKSSDRALIRAFGYTPVSPASLSEVLPQTDLIFNTAPAKILSRNALDSVPHCIGIDLASTQGLEGSHVTKALGLPGKLAPITSGRLIADTILRLGKEVF